MRLSRETRFVALCCAVYFTSYLTRKCYEASILAICDSTGLARTAAGLGGTALVALYGSGQFVTGWLADRIDPRKIVLAALLLTAACNAAMPFAVGRVAALVALSALNGFAQAMFWPPLVKLLAGRLESGSYKGAVFAVNVAANVAVIAVFALVAGCVRFADWRFSFAAVAAAALAMAALWQCCTPLRPSAEGTRDPARRSRQDGVPPSCSAPPAGLRGLRWLVPVIVAIVCLGAMRDGIEAWAPGIVKDVYGLGTSGSVLSVAMLPVFAVASMAAARMLRRCLGDEIRSALALFAIGFACAAVLLVSGGASLAVGLPLLSILSASMHGANLMLVCELPGRFAASGRVGTVSGILNSGVYLGAAVSICLFPALREYFAGWRPVFALWAAILAVGSAMLSMALHPLWERVWRLFGAATEKKI